VRQIADRIGEPALVIVADRLMGTALLTAGRPREAQQYLERVLRSSTLLDGQWRPTRSHSEHRALARAILARALWLQGFTDRALTEAHASLDELHVTDSQLSACRALYYGVCRIAPMTGEFATADQAITRMIEVVTRLNAPFWLTAGRFLEGKLLVERAEFAEGLAVLREAFNICRQTGWRMSYPEFKGALASALAGLGQLDEALQAVDDAITGAGERENGQQWYVPELLRIKAEVLLQQDSGRAESAENCFHQAGEVAHEQGALFWELRIALSLARLRVIQDRQHEALQILAPIYHRFTEGFGTADLRAARAILDTLPLA
jgi:predicted ATPase